MDVNTQEGLKMTMKNFVKYYFTPLQKRKKLLNVLSLEFSNTEMAEIVQGPAVIKELDWVELVWPIHLRQLQIDQTNAIKSMKYPKVQNYCLMSVAGCYTDFHVDFGGTSVWYHVWHGAKIFWLAPPTDQNLLIFKHWTLSGRQNRAFLGDFLENCFKIRLTAGSTFMIPAGWIHAVYTEEDSLVFGGNFLHSFAMKIQLKIYQLELDTHVPIKFRYPFFQEMLWYMLNKYFTCLGTPNIDTNLTLNEIEGLNCVVNFLIQLPQNKRKCPLDIVNPDLLLLQCKEIVNNLLPNENLEIFNGKLAISSRQKEMVKPSETSTTTTPQQHIPPKLQHVTSKQPHPSSVYMQQQHQSTMLQSPRQQVDTMTSTSFTMTQATGGYYGNGESSSSIFPKIPFVRPPLKLATVPPQHDKNQLNNLNTLVYNYLQNISYCSSFGTLPETKFASNLHIPQSQNFFTTSLSNNNNTQRQNIVTPSLQQFGILQQQPIKIELKPEMSSFKNNSNNEMEIQQEVALDLRNLSARGKN